MKFWKVILGCSITGLIVASLVHAISPSKSTMERAQEMTVLITNNSMEGTGLGTGVLLDSTHVLTCYHLSRTNRDDFMVFTYPLGRVIPAKLEGGNQATDLAILVLESSVTVTETPVFQDKWELGEPITVVGNALGGMQWFVTKGIISGFSQGYLLTDALINPGNSGGPWINAKGEIVALSDWGLGPAPHVKGLAGGVSSLMINRMLDARKQQAEMNGILLQIMGSAK